VNPLLNGSTLETLIAASRRRAFLNLAFEQAGWAASVAFAALILLLVAGTQVMSWVWPVVLLLLGLAVGGFRLRGRIPSPYSVAQRLDARLHFRDLLSTAWHFDEHPPAHPDFVGIVRAQAEETASSVRPADAIPFAWPRAAWPALGLALAAALTLGLRYGRLQTLDLSAPLVQLQFDPFSAFTGGPPIQAKRMVPPGVAQPIEISDPDTSQLGREPIPENALMTVDTPDPNGTGQANQAGDRKDNSRTGEKGGSEEGDVAEGEKGAPNSDNASDAPPGAKGDTKSGQQSKQPPQSKDSNTLMDKMRDALANLMDKLKMESNSQQQTAQNSKQSTPGPGQKSERGQKSPGKSPSKGDPNSDSESQAGQEASDQQGQKSAQNQQSPEQPSNQDKSGIGSSDGSKDTELAEQLDAMGKISEILGKRSQNIQGEMMVEVTSTKQQLRTPYLQRKSAHGESGGEIHRDEVPLHLQHYVQQYYEQVRKQPAPPAVPKP
jgi:hypothetical protein